MSGRYRDDDLAYGSYQAQGESQGGEEGERGFVGDTLNSLLGRRPQGQQSVREILNVRSTSSLIHDYRTSLKPTNLSFTASNNSHMADHPLVIANLHQDNNNSRLTVDHLPVTTNRHQEDNNNNSHSVDHLPVTANLHQDSNDHLALHLAGRSFLANFRMQYMTLVRNSRASCQGH